MTTTSYARRDGARVAAKKAGIKDPVITLGADGRFTFKAPAKAVADAAKGAKMEAARVLMRTKGATAAEIAALNDWAAHTVTNFLCTLRTVEKLTVEKTRNKAKAWVYKIAA